MQATFTDLVGTAIVPAHCFDTDELTDLTPALDTATAAHDMAAQASELSPNCELQLGTSSRGFCARLRYADLFRT